MRSLSMLPVCVGVSDFAALLLLQRAESVYLAGVDQPFAVGNTTH